MALIRLTRKIVEQSSPATGRIELWDLEARGLGIRITASGRRTWTMKYSWLGNQKRVTLGEYPGVSLDEARAQVHAHRAQLAAGDPPHLTRPERKGGVLVRELAAEFLDKHVNPKLRQSTAKAYSYVLRKILVPSLGHLRVDHVQPRDLEDMHRALLETPRLANMTMTVASKLFERAEAWGYRQEGTNPARFIEKFHEEKRERFLSEEDLKALWAKLDELEAAGAESVYLIAGIRLSILTGMRPGEVWSLTWPSVDLDHRTITLLRHKTSRTAGKRLVALPEEATAILRSLPHKRGTSLVFPGDRPGCHANYKDGWLRIRRQVPGIEDVHLHDLRHSFATFAELLGTDKNYIGYLLGQSSTKTTSRYTHAVLDKMKADADRVGAFIQTITAS